MKAIFGFAVICFWVFESYARTFEITLPTGKTVGKFRIGTASYEASLNFDEGFPKGIRYGIYVHGIGTCRSFDPTLSSVVLVNPETGDRKSGYDPKEYFLIAGSVPTDRFTSGSIRYHPGYRLETDFTGRVITLQEAESDSKPSGRIFNCWVY